MRRAPSGRSEQGFTLIEVMAAALVLVIGMLSILAILQKGAKQTVLNRQRVSAVNLAREITETARTVSYASLTPGQAPSAIQAVKPELVSTDGSIWTVQRGATTYTVALSTCAFDDPADQIASAPPANKCADNPGGTLGDRNGDDFRRITVDVSWTDRSAASTRTQTMRQTTLVVNPSGGIGPRILSFPNAADVTSGSTASFSLTTSPSDAVHWVADDGSSEGDATTVSGTSWTITWPLQSVGAENAVLDGTYTVSAKALDDRGVVGDTKVAVVTVDRSAPFPVDGFRGGHVTRDGNDVVDFEWELNQERDIRGYEVVWAGADDVVGNGDDVRVCPAGTATLLPRTTTSCQHAGPPTPPAAASRYYIRAYDTARVGTPSEFVVPPASAPPEPPQNLTIAGIDDPTLTWSAPATGAPAFYRIYRDGTAVANRFSRTGATETTFTDQTANEPHQYWVAAVDASLNESVLAGPLGWAP